VLTAGYLRWAEAIETPALGQLDIVDQQALPARSDPRELIRAAAKATDLADHLAAIEQRHPFYDAVRKALAAEQAGPARSSRMRLLHANLARARLLPREGRHIVVDTATQRLWLFDGRQIERSMKVVVGAPAAQTPTMASVVEEAIARPYWNVPEDLAQDRVARRVLRHGVQHLRQQHLKLLSDWTDDAVEIAPDTVDWKAAAARQVSIRLRQDPGPWNMMGAMKFMIRNDQGIYLHDSPERALFKRANRLESAGCIRVEDWRLLANWLFEGAPPSEISDPEQIHRLPRPVPIYVLHLTVDPTNPARKVADAYGRDRLLLAAVS
jgi:L,D-transpeptidase YcbB